MSMLKVLDLFSGIGGFSLGLERAGMQTMAFCEIDAKAMLVLKKHWPNVPVYEDVTKLNREILERDGITDIDVICGGFPCQDISLAGKGAGLAGERSGLWFEFHRIIAEIRPRYAIIENVSALRSRGLDQVLRSLAEIGYDAEWHCIPASAVGAPHRRDRIWIVAYPHDQDRSCQCADGVADADGESLGWITEPWGQRSHWLVEPDVGRVANGVPGRVDRLRQLGNAVVPQVVELIGRAITNHEGHTHARIS